MRRDRLAVDLGEGLGDGLVAAIHRRLGRDQGQRPVAAEDALQRLGDLGGGQAFDVFVEQGQVLGRTGLDLRRIDRLGDVVGDRLRRAGRLA